MNYYKKEKKVKLEPWYLTDTTKFKEDYDSDVSDQDEREVYVESEISFSIFRIMSSMSGMAFSN